MKKDNHLKNTIPTIIFGLVIFCLVSTSVFPFTTATDWGIEIHKQHKNQSPTNFTIIALPDTQKYTAYYPEIFTNQTQWIVANREALNIVWVGHEGDITEGGTELEFQRANTSMSLLENPNTTGLPYGIPYTIIPGNHDHDIYHVNDFFNQYFNYTRFEGRPYYGGHCAANNDNNYALFNASGMDFIVVGIDVWPSYEEIIWADTILQAYPNRRAIVISHDVINQNGAWSSSGYWIYNILKHNSNLFLILCGHYRFAEGEAKRTDIYNGNVVYTLLANYQSYAPYGGNGFLRIMTFDPAANQIKVQTYSPYFNFYIFDESSQFNLTYYMTSPPPLICNTGGPYTAEIDQTIHFTGTAIGGKPPYTWTWTLGDGSSSTDQNPDHRYTAPGSYNVILSVTDANSTVATSSTKAFISEPPEEPVIVIDTITGGFGVKAVIKNIGGADAVDVPWSIALDGNLIFFGTSKAGTIDIKAHTSVTLKSIVFGFGTTNINITADTVTKSTPGNVFLVFVNTELFRSSIS
jgi:hypothetical protein